MSDDGEEKSHEPTQKKLDDARKEGQVLSSKEAFVFATLGAGTGLLALSSAFGPALLSRWTSYFRIGPKVSLDQLMTERLTQFGTEFLLGGILFALPIAVVVIALQLTMGGINFAPKAFSFNFTKLDPMAGLGRMVSMRALVELGKSILKVSALGALAYLALNREMNGFGDMFRAEIGDSVRVIWSAILGLLSWLCLGLAAIGALDLGYQIFTMRQKLMMTHQELKQESKEANGSPEVKGRMRRMAMEMSQNSKRRAALADVPQATAIITNPTHFAVALRYVPGEMAAPMIIALGKGPMAQEIIALGKGAGVQVLQSPPLARALYFTGEVGLEISDRLFGAVAAILAHVYRLDRGEASEQPSVEVPDELHFNEFGRPIKDGKAK
jgi:flagellar biosynthesis protein FlhB